MLERARGRPESAAERAARELVARWRTRNVLVRDGALALAIAAVAFAPGLVENGVLLGELPERRLDGWGVLLGLAQCLPLVARRRRPVICLTLAGGAFAVDQALGYVPSFGSEGVLIALYSGGAYIERRRESTAERAVGGRRWVVAGVAIACYAVLVVVLHRLGSPERAVEFVTFWLVLAGCWAAGCWTRAWRIREEQRRLHSAQLAVAEERARIARELHDVVTHHVTAMVVQSDAARFLLPGAPDRVDEGLDAIGRTGRRALVELRYLLDVLSRPEDSTPDQPGPADQVARPGLPHQRHDSSATSASAPTSASAAARAPGRMSDLVETARSAGQPVELVERGQPRQLHGSVALAAYRVVQEALTNAVKYAPGRRTVVRLAYDAEGIDIDVVNDGEAVPSSRRREPVVPAGRRGLTGLRERVGVFGGELSAGPRPDGGFRVRTRLPLGEPR
ncbi:histidine kinase [Streptomyces sp. NPDC005423]|uniref:sensor histidine kinase n=1 Tax=Streptomyces sp. NPDC005423 TaxID=3155343 RepID=UPI0033A846A1